MTPRIMLTGTFELTHRAPQPSCDLLGEEVIARCSGKFPRWIFKQIVDMLEFLSFFRQVLSAPRQISLSLYSLPSDCFRIIHT